MSLLLIRNTATSYQALLASTTQPTVAMAGVVAPAASLASTLTAPTTNFTASVVSYTPLAQAPLLSAVAQWQDWGHAAPVVVRDKFGAGDLFTFGTPAAASGKLHILTSQNKGETWTWPADDSYAQTVPTSNPGTGVASIAQDSTGNVHIVYRDSAGATYSYYRCTPTRDVNGHIIGYSGLTAAINVESLGTFGSDRRCNIYVFQSGTGVESVVILNQSSDVATGTFATGWVSVSSTLTPVLADFKSLTGTASSSTQVYQDITTSGGGSHDHIITLAQIGSTKDIWVFGGPQSADGFPATPLTVQRVKLTVSGSTWTVGSLLVGTMGAGIQGTNGLCLLGAMGTANYAWAMVSDYTNGQIRFLRVDSSGTYEEPVSSIPSPIVDGNTSLTGYGHFNVHEDETRIWAHWSRDPIGGGNWYDFHLHAGFWNGTTWKVYDDAAAHGDAQSNSFDDGFGGLQDPQFEGAIGLQTRCTTAFQGIIYLTAIRGGIVAGTVQAGITPSLPAPTVAITGSITGAGVSGSIAVTVPTPVVAITGNVVDFTATIAASTPAPVAAITGNSVTGTIAATTPAPTAAITGSVVDFIASISASTPAPTVAITGSSTTGTITAATPAPIAAITGSVVDFTGAITTSTPAPTVAITGSSVTGTIAASTPAPTTAITGSVVDFVASISASTPAPVVAITGSSVTGSLASTLPAPVVAITGTASGATVTGSIAVTVPTPVVAITGNSVSGTIAASTPAPTTSITGSVVDFVASIATTVPAPTVAITGSSTTASLALTLPAPVVAITGNASSTTVSGSIAITLPAPVAAITGSSVTGSIAGTLPGPVVAITGNSVTGTIAASTPAPTVAIAGSVVDFVASISAATPAPTVAITGSSTTGSITVSIPAPAVAITGSVVDFIASISSTLPAPVAALTGNSVTGSLGLSLPAPVVAITGNATSTTTSGSIAVTVPTPTVSITGSSVSGTIAATLPAPTAAITGNSVTASIAGLIATPVVVISAKEGASASLALTLPAPTAAITGSSVRGTIAATVQTPVVAITANEGASGAIAATVPAPVAAITGSTVRATLSSVIPAPTTSITCVAGDHAIYTIGLAESWNWHESINDPVERGINLHESLSLNEAIAANRAFTQYLAEFVATYEEMHGYSRVIRALTESIALAEQAALRAQMHADLNESVRALASFPGPPQVTFAQKQQIKAIEELKEILTLQLRKLGG